jgi:hypothetical protein
MAATIGNASGAIQGAIKGTTGVAIAQDNIIFGLVLLAFVLWIVQKGELQTYLAFFKGQGAGFVPVPVTGTPAQAAANSAQQTAVGQAGAALGNLTGASGFGNTQIGSAIRGFLNSPSAQATPSSIPFVGGFFKSLGL